jgi:DMSO/TMAO reductase YedYZ molybdopterin-dependent catalytic subunit
VVQRIVSETVRREQRIPPGQRKTAKFPRLDLGVVPPFDPERWKLEVWGAVGSPVALDWPDFQALEHVELEADFHCVTRWSRLGLVWRGVPVRTILDLVRPRSDATALMAHAAEGYTTNVPLEEINAADALLADGLEGKPLQPEHGGPLRLVLPRLYGWKSCKWLRGLEFLVEDPPGFWEERGYHPRGEVRAQERFW